MGNLYVALNHDRKEAFQLGKSSFYLHLLSDDRHNSTVSPIVRDVLLAELRGTYSHWTDAQINTFADEFIAFKPHSIYDDCSDTVLEYYRHYVYTGSVYDDDADIGSPIHEECKGDSEVWDADPSTAPHLQGQLGTIHGPVLYLGNPEIDNFVREVFLGTKSEE